MRIMIGNRWTSGFLDDYRSDDQYRLAVRVYAPIVPVEDVYFKPPRELRRLVNYLREVGPTRLFHKVVSRLREGGRNEKFVAVGLGEVLEAPRESSDISTGELALFLAPLHPRCVERLALAPELVRRCPEGIAGLAIGSTGAVGSAEIRAFEPGSAAPSEHRFAELGGYTPFGGEPLDSSLLDALFESAVEALRATDRARARTLPVDPGPPCERTRATDVPSPESGLQAVLYGYGHYAKTNILPNLPGSIRMAAVHEVDPTQLGDVDRLPFVCDTSPGLRAATAYDVYFLAGYHHTHAPLASEALRAGAWVVSEKPLVTTRTQLTELAAASAAHPGRFFAGFHKRYARFNQHTHEDLDVRVGDPIHYYCIVYEVPLPERHWYRWPNSRSRITSNGCHWIDHFLFLNDFPDVDSSGVHEFPDGDALCWAEASNGASFSMMLTDKGSNRIGLEEYVELRTPQRTISVRNNSSYRAESRSRVLRKARANKNLGYSTMYRTIAEKIVRGEPGDTTRSIQCSSGLMLDLEEGEGRSVLA